MKKKLQSKLPSPSWNNNLTPKFTSLQDQKFHELASKAKPNTPQWENQRKTGWWTKPIIVKGTRCKSEIPLSLMFSKETAALSSDLLHHPACPTVPNSNQQPQTKRLNRCNKSQWAISDYDPTRWTALLPISAQALTKLPRGLRLFRLLCIQRKWRRAGINRDSGSTKMRAYLNKECTSKAMKCFLWQFKAFIKTFRKWLSLTKRANKKRSRGLKQLRNRRSCLESLKSFRDITRKSWRTCLCCE